MDLLATVGGHPLSEKGKGKMRSKLPQLPVLAYRNELARQVCLKMCSLKDYHKKISQPLGLVITQIERHVLESYPIKHTTALEDWKTKPPNATRERERERERE